MFFTVLRREAKEGFISFAFLSALALLTVLVPLSAYTQASYYRHIIADNELRQSIHQSENSNQSVALIRPVPPLLPFFNGVYNYVPDEVTLRSNSAFRNESSEDLAPLDWIFPKIDLSLIVGVLGSLMAILLGHDAVTGEREQGTLQLMLSSPISRRAVLAAKLTGIMLLMASSLAYIILLYTLTVRFFSGGTFQMTSSNLVGLAAYTLLSLLVLTVFATFGIAVSTMSKHSYISIIICITIWVSAVLIWPSLGPYLASSIRPVTSRQTFQRELLAKEAELIQAELSEHRSAASALQAQGVDVEVAWQRYFEIRRRWMDRKRQEIAQITDERKKEVESQLTIANRILLLSPYCSFKEALGELCGTGLQDYQSFLDATGRYEQEEFAPGSLESLAREKPWVEGSGGEDEFQFEPFRFRYPPLAERLEGVALIAGLLMLEAALIVALSLIKFNRYDVR